MSKNLKEQLIHLISHSLEESIKKLPKDRPPIEIEVPNDKQHGDFSCNVAMRLAKPLKQPPAKIAQELISVIEKQLKNDGLSSKIDKVEVKNPGFINFYLSNEALYDVLYKTFEEDDRFGSSDLGKGQKWQIEFVSANPTGPLSVAHARQAAVGDALGNILSFLGFDLTKEYYINDKGNQVNLLGASTRIRAEEKLKGEDLSGSMTDDHYKGEYVKDIAKDFITKKGITSEDQLQTSEVEQEMADYGKDYLLKVIQKDLEDFQVKFDVWSSESAVATQDKIDDMIDYMGEKGFMYEKDGALWFQSTTFGDDKDRVLQKSDDTYTYLTPDIVYHKNKFERGFNKVINIWGPDHHGYIPRIKAAAEALGYDRDDVTVLIVQLATIYRNGHPVSMSTRQGQFISLREVIDEVGVDAARFFFLMRKINQHLDFDLDLAKQETPENPVYYVQYAHARIHSIMKKAKEEGLTASKTNLSLLKEEEELDLIRKISHFQAMLTVCYKQLDPYSLGSYLQELATTFHRFYDRHKVVGEDQALSAERLALIDAVRIVLANGLRLLGVSVPKQM